jgi:hypothetical protein
MYGKNVQGLLRREQTETTLENGEFGMIDSSAA